MKNKIFLGAPSSTGKGAKELIAATFAHLAFPLAVTFENRAAHAVSLPEVGLTLQACTHDGKIKTVVIKDFDALQRLGSSIEQIAFLHGHKVPMISLQDANAVDEGADEASGETAESETTDEAGGEAEEKPSDPPKPNGPKNDKNKR